MDVYAGSRCHALPWRAVRRSAEMLFPARHTVLFNQCERGEIEGKCSFQANVAQDAPETAV